MKNQNVPVKAMPVRHAPTSSLNPTKLINSIVDVVCVIDKNGVFRYVSQSGTELFGYSPREMMGSSFIEFIHPEDVQKTIHIATSKTPDCQTSNFENRYVRKDGTVVSVLWSGKWDNQLLYCVARNGTEKRDLEQRLLKAQQIARVANFEYDILGDYYTYASDTLFEIFGIDRAKNPSFTTELFWALVHPDDLAMVKQSILKLDHSSTGLLQYRIIRPDGQVVYLNRLREVVYNANGQAIKTIGTIQDITDQKINELALRQSEERFRSLVQNSYDMLAVIDKEGNYRFVGGNVKELLGFHRSELMGVSAFQFIHPEDAEWAAPLLQTIKPGKAMTVPPFRFKNSDGQWRWIEATVSNQLEDVAICGLVVNSRDITERKKQEEEIFRLSLIAKETESAVVITTPDRKTIWVNAAFTRMTGYELEEVIDKRLACILEGPETDPNTVEFILEAYKASKPFQIEILNYRKNGEPFWSEIQVQPLFDSKGNVQQFFSIRKDITERKKLESELRQERLKTTAAVIAAQEKERAVVSQELHDNVNQVLTTVKLYTEMCRDGIGNSGEIMAKSIQLLQDSINEIRSLSKRLSAPSIGKIKLFESVNELVAAVVATRKIKIHLNTERIKDLEVHQEAHLTIYRILQEHLTNILKHAGAENVEIMLYHREGRLHLQVKDDGRGFDIKKKSEGIGLTNMRTRTESLKGCFSINSAPEQGCELKLSIPL